MIREIRETIAFTTNTLIREIGAIREIRAISTLKGIREIIEIRAIYKNQGYQENKHTHGI